jgi:hypothetical protein
VVVKVLIQESEQMEDLVQEEDRQGPQELGVAEPQGKVVTVAREVVLQADTRPEVVVVLLEMVVTHQGVQPEEMVPQV